MTAGKVADYLLNNCKSFKFFESYMFGSTLNGIGHDIDILVVGPSGDKLDHLKRELAVAGSELPLDVLYMLPCEATETDFINITGCISLAELAETDSSQNTVIHRTPS